MPFMDTAVINVLLIEDNPDDVLLLQETLSEPGGPRFHIESMDRLTAGLERLAQMDPQEKIDVVLLDLSLPDSRGIDTFKSIRRQFPNVPVVLLTGLDNEALALEAVQEGAQDYLIKGGSASDSISRSIRYAIERHRLLVETEQERKRSTSLSQELQESLTQLHYAQQQVLQQERLRALGQMASGVAHDFNNALSAIMGYTDLLLVNPKYLNDPVKSRDCLQRIKAAAQNAGEVVSRLREFYRPRDETEEFHPVDLNQLVRGTVILTRPRWQALARAHNCSIDLVSNLTQTPAIAGNEAQLRDMLINLIFNAVDAMPSGGSLSLNTRHEGGQVVLQVDDTGTGMTEEVRRRCLEPWFTTKGDQGTGLGLAMVYGIVQRHGGVIDIKSKVGKGTNFTISLPALSATAAPLVEPDAWSKLQPLSVLVVDDDPQVREVLVDYLAMDGHKAEAAAGGREGLEMFLGGQFDLAVVDLAIPELNGAQLATIFKQLTPPIRIISLTGFGDMLDNAGGADLVLGKPVTLEELRQAVVRVVLATSPEPIRV
jgi:signal transduction histidine kinase